MNKWLRRKRNSHGYGVQSPNDFFFVQHVLRGQSPYYAYTALHELYKIVKADAVPLYREEIYRILFRLTDYVHPEAMIEVGSGAGLSICSMTMACPMHSCVAINAEDRQHSEVKRVCMLCPQIIDRVGDEVALLGEELQERGKVEFLHIGHTLRYKEIVQIALPYVCDKTLIVIDGIHENAEKRHWWKSLQESALTGVSYDLGTLGLLFFDHSRYKNAYWINIKKKRLFRSI